MNNVLGTLAAVTATVLLAVVAVNMGRASLNGSEAANVISEINTLAGNIKSTFSAGGANYAGLSVCQMEGADLVPENMISGGVCSALINPWGGSIGLEPVWGNSFFQVDVYGVPSSACVQLATGLGDARGVYVSGYWYWPGWWHQPVPASWASQYCTAAGSGSNGGNQVSFIFN